MRLTTALTAALPLAVTLTACTTPDPEPESTLLPIPSPTGTPTVMEDATIIWADGIQPTGELEDHPLVKTYRAAELGRAMAWNTGDFTITQFTDNVAAWQVASAAKKYTNPNRPMHAYTFVGGWQPLEILSYDATRGGRVAVCRIRVSDAYESSDGPQTSYDRTRIYRGLIELTYENGRLRARLDMESGDDTGTKPCDGSQVPVGYLDPLPTVPEDPENKPFRAPLYPGWNDPSSFDWRIDEP